MVFSISPSLSLSRQPAHLAHIVVLVCCQCLAALFQMEDRRDNISVVGRDATLEPRANQMPGKTSLLC